MINERTLVAVRHHGGKAYNFFKESTPYGHRIHVEGPENCFGYVNHVDLVTAKWPWEEDTVASTRYLCRSTRRRLAAQIRRISVKEGCVIL